MHVTFLSRGTTLVCASVLAAGALVATATAALAWVPPSVKVSCDTSEVAITLTDVSGDYATSNTLDFTGPNGRSFTETYNWGSQAKNTSQTFKYPLSDFPNGSYTVHPATDSTAKSTTSFAVSCTKPTPTPTPTPTPKSTPKPTPTPTATPSGGGAGGGTTPGLPATGFDPNS